MIIFVIIFLAADAYCESISPLCVSKDTLPDSLINSFRNQRDQNLLSYVKMIGYQDSKYFPPDGNFDGTINTAREIFCSSDLNKTPDILNGMLENCHSECHKVICKNKSTLDQTCTNKNQESSFLNCRAMCFTIVDKYKLYADIKKSSNKKEATTTCTRSNEINDSSGKFRKVQETLIKSLPASEQIVPK